MRRHSKIRSQPRHGPHEQKIILSILQNDFFKLTLPETLHKISFKTDLPMGTVQGCFLTTSSEGFCSKRPLSEPLPRVLGAGARNLFKHSLATGLNLQKPPCQANLPRDLPRETILNTPSQVYRPGLFLVKESITHVTRGAEYGGSWTFFFH